MTREQMVIAERLRLAQVKATMADGAKAGKEWLDPKDEWKRSRAYRALFPAGTEKRRHDHRMMTDLDYYHRWRRRHDELKGAFFEGHAIAARGEDHRKMWLFTDTRANLYPGPRTPLHKRTMLASMGLFDPNVTAGGPGEW